MFALIRLISPNLMILDEPTNHIDLQGREQLERQLDESDTTLIVTSHDRRFLENVANRFWVIRDGKLIEDQSLDDFYQNLGDGRRKDIPEISDAGLTELGASQAGMDQSSWEEACLLRIDKLESLLKADKARKIKFQKAEKQLVWQQELDKLWRQLE